MSTKVSAIAYALTEDVNPEKHLNAQELEEAKDVAIARAINALENTTESYTDFQLANIQTSLQSAQSTHQAIRKVLAWGEEDPAAVDALALARLPLETLYNICMFTDAPDWVDVYVQDGWKKQYVQFLLQREETKALERFSRYSETTANRLGTMREIVGISPAQAATIDYEQLGISMPSGLTEDRLRWFPTPGKAIGKLPDGSDKRKMLERLYPEYTFLCSFVHGLTDANLFKMMFNKESRFRDLWTDEEIRETFYKEVSLRAYTTSLLSIIQSAAEIAALYPDDVELRAGVTTAWGTMSRESLLGKVIWEIRTRRLLGVLDAPPPAATTTS